MKKPSCLRNYLYLFCGFLLIIFPSKSFSQDNFLFFQILDQKSQQPVVFATVEIKSEGRGTIADENGMFKVPAEFKQKKMTVSCIGYYTKTLTITGTGNKEISKILLAPKTEILDVVTITAKNKSYEVIKKADEIVKKSIQNLLLNFPTQPHSYTGYYRDYQYVNDQYFNLNEAIIKDYDAGFHSNKIFDKGNRTALYTYSRNDDFPVDEGLLIPYQADSKKFIESSSISGFGGNELTILNIHNAIRRFDKNSFSFVYVFRKDFPYNHQFRIQSVVEINDTPMYKIAFYALENVVGAYHKADGYIYIDCKDFGIHKFEYFGYLKKEEDPLYALTVEYKTKDDRYYLNYISFYNKFKAKSSKSFKISTTVVDSENTQIVIAFNQEIDKKSLRKNSQIKVKGNGKKIKTTDFKFISEKEIAISVNDFAQVETAYFDDLLEIDVKRVKDVAGRRLNQIDVIDAKQYREFFVQEVKIKDEPSKNLKYLNTLEDLNSAPLNPDKDIEKSFWINSPLIKSK
ncbi:MAG: carboxypeptidase-like regulatory domain-containing protein [Bacteroidota bacterium]